MHEDLGDCGTYIDGGPVEDTDEIDRKIFSRRHSVIVCIVGNCKRLCLVLMFIVLFCQRVVNHWNALKQHAVDCNTVNSFMRCLDRYIKDRGLL